LVEPEFGTGCVKVTPAHDLNDFDDGSAHCFINIMNKDGSLNENAGPFQGQTFCPQECGATTEADGVLGEGGVAVPYSDRGKVPVEPLLSTQWFVLIRPLADRALEFLDQHNSQSLYPSAGRRFIATGW